MSIKRVSDLKKRSLSPDSRDNFKEVLDDAYAGGTELANSLMEISWNKNPSKIGENFNATGDDNEFESQAITVHALSAGITDALYNRDVTLKGNKSIQGDVEITGNVSVNKDVDLEVNKYNVELYGYDTIITSEHDTIISSKHDTIISSEHHTVIKGQVSVIIEIDNPDRPDTNIGLYDKNLICLSSGNHLSIFGCGDVNLIYGPPPNGNDDDARLTIWHRYKDGHMKAMLDFKGDNVTARGKWSFPESSPTTGNLPIDGYIKHAYYS